MKSNNNSANNYIIKNGKLYSAVRWNYLDTVQMRFFHGFSDLLKTFGFSHFWSMNQYTADTLFFLSEH